MDSSLRERLARLGPIRATDRVSSGSPAVFVLRLCPKAAVPKTIDGMAALAERGLTMLKDKRAIEALVEERRVFVSMAMLEDGQTLVDELARAGIKSAPVEPREDLDVRRLRQRLRLTREQFALRYGMEVEAIRNWETGKRRPDKTAQSYLRAISNAPEHVEQAYAPTR